MFRRKVIGFSRLMAHLMAIMHSGITTTVSSIFRAGDRKLAHSGPVFRGTESLTPPYAHSKFIVVVGVQAPCHRSGETSSKRGSLTNANRCEGERIYFSMLESNPFQKRDETFPPHLTLNRFRQTGIRRITASFLLAMNTFETEFRCFTFHTSVILDDDPDYVSTSASHNPGSRIALI